MDILLNCWDVLKQDGVEMKSKPNNLLAGYLNFIGEKQHRIKNQILNKFIDLI